MVACGNKLLAQGFNGFTGNAAFTPALCDGNISDGPDRPR